jgi:hypothetical protein
MSRKPPAVSFQIRAGTFRLSPTKVSRTSGASGRSVVLSWNSRA